MPRISIVKVENPSCLWGHVVCGSSSNAVTTEHYNSLLTQMNLFYHDVTNDLHKLKPKSLEEGQVCVVYWAGLKSWCRAVVESVITDSVSSQARCLLVDHGERLLIPLDQIRVAKQDFLKLPHWVRKFHLGGIKPTTLRVSALEKAKLMPSGQWDSSATLYLHRLLQASNHKEAILTECGSDSTSMELYLTIDNIKICVNDDLVAKKFAYYIDGGSLDEEDQFPVMLSSSILTQPSSTASISLTTRIQPPRVMPENPATAGSGDWLTASSPPQVCSQQDELVTTEGDSRSEFTDHLPLSSQSRSALDLAAAESDSLEDTDDSLAAALTKNLSLFRFLKFLNPGSSYHQAAPTVDQNEELNNCQPEETTASSSGCTEQELDATSMSSDIHSQVSGAGEVVESGQIEHLSDQETSSTSVESGSAETWGEEAWACSRLLEWLNPEPLNPDTEDDVISPSDPSKSGILVHTTFPVEPCNSLDDAPVTDTLRWVLQKKQYSTLSPADRYSWPAVARGCNTMIVSPNADDPLSYLIPLLTHILLTSIFTSHPSTSGPLAVILCPGWEKVQAVYALLEQSKVAHILHPVSLLLGTGKDEAKAVKIPNNCLLLVTTPFTLVRLLPGHSFLFLRVYHLVLDEADQLFTLAPDQMVTILQHFQKLIFGEEKASCPQQLVAVAKRWTNQMEGLLATHMPHPCIVITAPKEAALYGNVQQIILMTLEIHKISVLLGALDFNPDIGQKTLIVANSAQDVEDVFKAVSNKSAFCLKSHEGLMHEFDFVIQQWRKEVGPGTQVILVITSTCLKCLGISDATCVVHYSFPSSPKLFGSRLFCMAANFRNLSEQVESETVPHVTRSVLLISERNTHHVVGLLRYLRRTNAPLPPELLSFAQGIHLAQEEQKMNRPLCSYLKSFGVCRDSGVCPDRHRFIPQLDQSQLPASGVIEVLPLYIKTASVFYGRIIRKGDQAFDIMTSQMASYYADKKPGARELLEGGLYTVQEEELFHRVKILSVPDRGGRLFFSVFVRFVDVGKEEEVKSHQILELPEQFRSLPGQAVELILCRLKPVDTETEWHPKVTRAVSQKIRGLQHRARAVLSLGNTVFLDPMVRVTRVPGLKTLINEHNVQSEILNTGMGVSNPEHVDLLKALCQEGLDGADKMDHTFESGECLPSLEVRIKAEEEVLAKAFRVAEDTKLAAPDPPHLEPCQPLSLLSSTNQTLVQTSAAPECHLVPLCNPQSQLSSQTNSGQRNTGPADMFAEQIERKRDGELCPTSSMAACVTPCEKGADQSSRQQVISTDGTDDIKATKWLHPQICWYQTSDSAIVTVKLMNPESQRCDFHPDRVVYSGTVNGRSYRADLELHQNIVADSCCWEIKSNEPVLKLIKQQQGYWERLVRNKNIFVRYDMGHFDEDDDSAPNGLWFMENTGENNWYMNSESGSESD